MNDAEIMNLWKAISDAQMSKKDLVHVDDDTTIKIITNGWFEGFESFS